MEVRGDAQEPTALEPDRREEPRFPVDEAAALDIPQIGLGIACRIVEISLTGCRLITRERFPTGHRVRVEIAFKLRGVAFRFNGVTEWADGRNQVGISFTDVSPRRMDELVEVLCEVAAAQAAKTVKDAAERHAAETKAKNEAPETQPAASSKDSPAGPDAAPKTRPGRDAVSRLPELVRLGTAPPTDPRPKLPELASVKTFVPPSSAVSAPLAGAGPTASLSGPLDPARPAPPPKPKGRERRNQSRHEIDTSVVLFLVNVASRLHGRILNLSLGGCRIRTEERFPVGIYTRVETEFRLEGLPFRLGGVVQAVQDKNHVGIRFLDMSERKREQLAQLIEEIEEPRQDEQSTEPTGRAGTPT